MNKKRDIFVNLPTRYGKSLIYQALTLCFDVLNITERIQEYRCGNITTHQFDERSSPESPECVTSFF
jgi:hypothetical protein